MPRSVRRPPGQEASPEVEAPPQEPEEIPAETREASETGKEAQVEVKMRGAATAVRNAARRIGNEPPAEPGERDEPVEDPIGRLLSDTGNMVVVTRLLPRVVKMSDGSTRRCSGRVEKYPCPITVEELEDDVFGRFGGKKFKVTIHPSTPTGEMKTLGGFVIENPDEELPIFPDDPEMPGNQPSSRFPNDVDPMLAPHPDPIVRAEQQAARRLEDALRRQRIKDLERQAKDAEDADKPPASSAASHPLKGDSDGRIQALEDRLSLKELRSEFDTKLSEIKGLLQNQRSAGGQGEGNSNSIVVELLKSNQTQFTEMMKAITAIQRPVPPPAPSNEMNFDKMLDMFTKLKATLGGDDSRVKRLEETLLESALERAMGGGEGPAEEEDTVKFAIRQMTPVLKTYVEKQIDKESAAKGREITAEERKRIYEAAAAKAAKDLEEEWKKKGYLVKAPPPGGKMPGVPQKKPPQGLPAPGQRTKTPEGEVETVVVEPAKTGAPSKTSKPAESGKEGLAVEEGEKMPKFADLPGVGKVEIPLPPGRPSYDQKKALNFVMDSMLSEIHERVPQDRPNDSYVVGDALQCLDDKLLSHFSQIDTGTELEQFLGAHGDAAKVEAIKKAGENEIVKSWVKRIVITIQDHWKREAAKGRG